MPCMVEHALLTMSAVHLQSYAGACVIYIVHTSDTLLDVILYLKLMATFVLRV